MNIQQMGRYYIDTPAYKMSADVKAAFRQFIIELSQVELQGVDFQYVDFQPYFRGPSLCLEDVYTDFNQRRLMITTQFNESDLLGPEVNMIYRCIHELHHLKLNVDFDWRGECATAAHLMSFTQNPLFQQIIFSEIIGQVAVWMSGGQFPERQKVVLFEPEVWHGLYKELGLTHLASTGNRRMGRSLGTGGHCSPVPNTMICDHSNRLVDSASLANYQTKPQQNELDFAAAWHPSLLSVHNHNAPYSQHT